LLYRADLIKYKQHNTQKKEIAAMKYIRLFLVLSFLVAGVGFTSQHAKAGAFTYSSSINLQNLSDQVGNLTIHYYLQNGAEDLNSPIDDTITALGSKVYFPIDATEGFNGSVVIESDVQIASISNILGNGGLAAAAYIGSANGGAPVLLPLLMHNNSGYNTWFNLQNAGNSNASVTVDYSDGMSVEATIAPGASQTFDQAVEAHTVKVFSAIVTSDQPIAATVVEENTTVMFAYSGFTSSSTNPVIPLVNEYNAGYRTGITILNSGEVATDVTVDYTPSGAGTACYETQTIPAGESKTFAYTAFYGDALLDTDCVAQTKFVGSGTVTANSTSQPLTAIVNQLKGSLNGEAYNAFDISTATDTVVLPLIMNKNGGYWTSINLMNVGESAATVTCTFTPYGDVVLPTPSETLDPNEGVSFLQNAPAEFGDTKYVGSATCTANGLIIAIVNEVGPSSTADQLLVYEGFNQ
jgi:hypothetical protein